MSIDLAALPDDVETLRALIGDLVRGRDSARAEAEVEVARAPSPRYPFRSKGIAGAVRPA